MTLATYEETLSTIAQLSFAHDMEKMYKIAESSYASSLDAEISR